MVDSVRAIILDRDKILLMDRNKYGSKFMSLIGGHIDEGEDRISALYREVVEETSIKIANPKLAIITDSDTYGRQYIYICDYVSGEAMLSPDSREYQDNEAGSNSYRPIWLKTIELNKVNLLPTELKVALINLINKGLPAKPIEIHIES